MVEQFTYAKYELKKKLEALRRKSGRDTELISLYIPHEKQISDLNNLLREEHGKASNIQSKFTRTNVQAAFESLLSKLRYVSKIPENGIVYFIGLLILKLIRHTWRAKLLFFRNLLYLTNIIVILFFILSLLRKYLNNAVLMGFFFSI